jgi:predicted phosphodiesterase
MTHKKKDLPEDLSNYDLVVFGHSHKYEEIGQGNTILLNPGSCGPRRFHHLTHPGVDADGIMRKMGY